MTNRALVGALCTALSLTSLHAQTRVAFVGDSISHGFTPAHPSYRAPLWQLLSSHCVDFVGTRIGCAGGSSLAVGTLPTGLKRFDQDHEAQSGRPAFDILAQWVVAAPVSADLYVIQAGTNDLAWWQPVMTPANTLAALVALTSVIQALPGSPQVCVCTLPGADPSVLTLPGISPTLLTDIARLNALITASPSPFPAGTLIAPIDVGFDPTPNVHTFDGIHPNDAGEAKIAATIFAAIGSSVISTTGFACWKEFGMGCEHPDANGDPEVGHLRQLGGRPILGANYQLLLSEIPANSLPIAFVSLTDFPPILIGPTAPGCTLLVDPTTTASPALVGGQWILTLPIPTSTSFIGTEVFVQGIAVGGGYNPLDALNTNAGIVRIGT